MCFWNSLAFSMTQWMLAIWSLVPFPFLNSASTSEWLYWLSGHESKQTLGDVEGQGSLACCSPWGCRESDTTERLTEQQRWLQLESSLMSVVKKKKEQSPGKVEEALQNKWLKGSMYSRVFFSTETQWYVALCWPQGPGSSGKSSQTLEWWQTVCQTPQRKGPGVLGSRKRKEDGEVTEAASTRQRSRPRPGHSGVPSQGHQLRVSSAHTEETGEACLVRAV